MVGTRLLLAAHCIGLVVLLLQIFELVTEEYLLALDIVTDEVEFRLELGAFLFGLTNAFVVMVGLFLVELNSFVHVINCVFQHCDLLGSFFSDLGVLIPLFQTLLMVVMKVEGLFFPLFLLLLMVLFELYHSLFKLFNLSSEHISVA